MNHGDKEVFKIDLIKFQHCYIARSIVVDLKLAETQQQMRFQRSIPVFLCYVCLFFGACTERSNNSVDTINAEFFAIYFATHKSQKR